MRNKYFIIGTIVVVVLIGILIYLSSSKPTTTSTTVSEGENTGGVAEILALLKFW